MTEDAKKPLGRILLSQRAVTQQELDQALGDATPGGPPLASRMIESGALSEIAALKALSEQSGVPGIDLNQVCIKLKDLDIVPREVAVRHKLLPILVREDRVFVAMAAPSEKKVIDEIEFVTGKRVFPYVALAGPLMRAIGSAYEMRDRGEPFYIGIHCPPEMQRKAGAIGPESPAPAPVATPAPAEGRHAKPPPLPAARPAAPAAPAAPPPRRGPPPPPLGRRTAAPAAAPPQALFPQEPDDTGGRLSDPDGAFRPSAPRTS